MTGRDTTARSAGRVLPAAPGRPDAETARACVVAGVVGGGLPSVGVGLLGRTGVGARVVRVAPRGELTLRGAGVCAGVLGAGPSRSLWPAVGAAVVRVACAPQRCLALIGAGVGPAVEGRALRRFRGAALAERCTVPTERVGRTGLCRAVTAVRRPLAEASRCGVGAGAVLLCVPTTAGIRPGRTAVRGTQERRVRALVRAGVHARPDRGGHVRARVARGGPEVGVQRVGGRTPAVPAVGASVGAAVEERARTVGRVLAVGTARTRVGG